MGKILINGIVLFIGIGVLITGGLLLANNGSLDNLTTSSNVKYNITRMEFGNEATNEFKKFTFSIYVEEGKLSITDYQTNLYKWNLEPGLNLPVNEGEYLTITLFPGASATRIFTDQDINEYWLEFTLSNNDIIRWQNYTYVKK
jgi:hypothetical protein